MSILVVGSVAFDTIATPSGQRERHSGRGGDLFFSGRELLHRRSNGRSGRRRLYARAENVLKKRGVDTRGIERAEGKTFRWGGQYLDNLNEAKTDFTELNVFEKFQPRIPKEYQDTEVSVSGEHSPDAAGRRCGGR